MTLEKVTSAVRIMIPFAGMAVLGWMVMEPAPYRYFAWVGWLCWGFVYFYDNPPWKR
jgi:1,4-dihydroxy-2-naphthoate octaprenyltransferase